MSIAFTLSAAQSDFPRRKWTVAECRFLTENGLLEAGKYELIEGDVTFKMPQGRDHIFVIARLIALLSAIFGADSVQSQAQIGIGVADPFNDPEPDVTVLQGTLRDYLEREPDPATEVLLVVEVSRTTLQGDLNTKALLYARYDIPEYWVVDLNHRQIIVHRQPAGGVYTSVMAVPDTGNLSLLSTPGQNIPVASVLP